MTDRHIVYLFTILNLIYLRFRHRYGVYNKKVERVKSSVPKYRSIALKDGALNSCHVILHTMY